MKTMTVRLPEPLVREIEAESYSRGISRSDVIRERLARPAPDRRGSDPTTVLADLIGSVGGLPDDLSGRPKAYLRSTGYGHMRPR